jgi:acetyl esterase/lipase
MATLACAAPPKAVPPPPTFADVKYGPHERNVLDFWRADTKEPAPVLVFIHGGGFIAGSKADVSPNAIEQCMKWGISFASISYRYSKQAPYPAPMLDGARAIQFLRTKAAAWHIDPKRIGAYGGSAGAGISMWVGFHDDLAKPDSADPVERQSSRLRVVATQGGQTTYNPLVIKEWIGGRAWEHSALLRLFACTSFDDYNKPEVRKLAEDSAAINHYKKGAPPIFMVYSEPDQPLPADAKPGQGIHHPIFGKKLKEKADALGLEAVLRIPGDGKSPANQAMLEFLRDKLKE